MWRLLLTVFGSALTFLAGSVCPAHSQIPAGVPPQIESPLENESVLGRARPEYDPLGLPLGAFRAYPTLSVGASYDDNVLRTDSDPQHDYVYEVTPGLNLRSEWVRHYLAASAAATHYRYSRLSSESRTEWNVAAGGRLDILTGFNLAGAVSHNATFEPRISRDQPGAAKRTPYTLSVARAALSYNPFRIGLQIGAAFTRYDYGHTELVPAFGGGERDNDDRNRDVYSMYTTALYEFAPGYGAFVRPSLEKVVYDLETGRATGRDSQAHRIDGGVSLLLTRLLTGEAYLGYIHQDFEGADFQTLSGLDFGGQLQWYPTELFTVHLNASRTPNATTLTGAAVGDDRNVEVGADYELLRNVIVQGGVAYTDTQFGGASRRDKDFSAQLGLRYLLNSYLTANLRVARITRVSTAAESGYVDNILFVGLRGHL